MDTATDSDDASGTAPFDAPWLSLKSFIECFLFFFSGGVGHRVAVDVEESYPTLHIHEQKTTSNYV